PVTSPEPFSFSVLFLIDPSSLDLYTLSLHDALPISSPVEQGQGCGEVRKRVPGPRPDQGRPRPRPSAAGRGPQPRCLRAGQHLRSEEHTSELQSRFDLVCRLLLEKKKKINPEETTLK